LEEEVNTKYKSASGRSDPQMASKPTSGQIWLVKTTVSFPDGHQEQLKLRPGQPHMVLLVRFDDDFEQNPHSVAHVFPISKQWIFASPCDLTFAGDISPLVDVPLMIECWNPRPVLKMNLLKPIAKLDTLALRDLQYVRSCCLRGVEPTQALESSAYTGPSLAPQDDPRTRFQKIEFERTDFLSAAAGMLN
jgi:hypothetical protein